MQNRTAHTAEARSVNRDERTIDVVASTFDIDSYGTRIDPNGWDLEQFRKNPVITWAHDDRGFTASGGRPIAKGENIRVEDGKLKMRLRFPAEGKFQFADEVFNLMADGFLNAVSVGFDPIEWRDEKTEDDGHVRVFTRQKLMEVAVVTIPSNDAALAERAKRMNADPEEVRSRVQRVEELANSMDEYRTIQRGDMKVEVRITDLPVFTAFKEEFEKLARYFDQKQPANRAATKVMEKFFKRILDEEIPADEVEAWQRMGEAVESMEKSEETEEVIEEETPEVVETQEVTEEPTEPTNPQPAEAPQDARKASVQIPLSELLAYPERLAKAYAEAGAEALLRGVPPKDVGNFIDGLNGTVHTSISLIQNGQS